MWLFRGDAFLYGYLAVKECDAHEYEVMIANVQQDFDAFVFVSE